MLAFLLILVVLGLAAAAVFFAEGDFLKAFQYSRQNKFKEAMYWYALGTLNSCFFKDNCRSQIALLWKMHGPFDGTDIYNSVEKSGDPNEVVSRDTIVGIIASAIKAP